MLFLSATFTSGISETLISINGGNDSFRKGIWKGGGVGSAGEGYVENLEENQILKKVFKPISKSF